MISDHKDEGITMNFGEENEFQPKKRFKHPVAVLFHLVFRVCAVATYIFCGWFSSSFIACFVVIVLLLSMDFWTVKNVTGRLLVGLRWWNQVDDDGKSHWVYESRKGAEKGLVRSAESRVFWLSLVATEAIWVLFLFSSIFRLSLKWLLLRMMSLSQGSVSVVAHQDVFICNNIWNLMVVLVGLILNGANLYGYVRCKLGSRESVKSAATSFLSKQMFTSMFRSATSSNSTNTTQS